MVDIVQKQNEEEACIMLTRHTSIITIHIILSKYNYFHCILVLTITNKKGGSATVLFTRKSLNTKIGLVFCLLIIDYNIQLQCCWVRPFNVFHCISIKLRSCFLYSNSTKRAGCGHDTPSSSSFSCSVAVCEMKALRHPAYLLDVVHPYQHAVPSLIENGEFLG